MDFAVPAYSLGLTESTSAGGTRRRDGIGGYGTGRSQSSRRSGSDPRPSMTREMEAVEEIESHRSIMNVDKGMLTIRGSSTVPESS